MQTAAATPLRAEGGKLAAIGELAPGFAHEINNPLFAILGLVEFLLRDTEPGTKAHERLVLIQQSGIEIKGIVKALQDFAREPAGDHGPLVLQDAVSAAVELLRCAGLAKEIEIVESYPAEPVSVVGRTGQIKQAVVHRLAEARRAGNGSGRIEVRVTAAVGSAEVSISGAESLRFEAA